MGEPRLEALSAIEDAIWHELGRAVQTMGHAWRVAVLATVQDGAADARNVVLRGLEMRSRTLLIYTDSRSPKAQQMQAQPRAVLVLWSQELGWQLRLAVSLSLETAGLRVSSRWAQLKLTPAAQDYMSPLPPGSVLDSAPTPERTSRDHFAVVAARVEAVDWLELHPDGHRRARFDAAGAAWLTP